MRRKWGTPAQRRWMNIAIGLPSTRNAICGYHEEGWEQCCGHSMHWRFVVAPKEGMAKCLRTKRIQYICPSCGSHFIENCGHYEYDETVKELIFEQYLMGFVAFVHHDKKNVGAP